MEDQFQSEATKGAQVNDHTLAEIEELFVYKVEPQLAFLALCQDLHLGRWWCQQCSADARAGGHVRLFFESNSCLLEITEIVPYQFMEWKCLDARTSAQTREDWIGAVISFQISRNNYRGTDLRLTHRRLGSSQARDHWMGIWKRYLGNSLKSYLESGVGQPAKL